MDLEVCIPRWDIFSEAVKKAFRADVLIKLPLKVQISKSSWFQLKVQTVMKG